MFIRKMPFRFTSLIIIAVFLLTGCRRCENTDFYLRLDFYNDAGMQFEPIFDRVYSLYPTGDFVQNSIVDTIPIDLSRDSTIMIFETGGQIDTLAFRYTRHLNYHRNDKGYCISLDNVHVLNSNSFENTHIQFGARDRSEDYRATIYF